MNNNHIFKKLAEYYDLVYNSKHYDNEVQKIHAILRKHLTKKVPEILDIGCGTGGHSLYFAQQGYSVTGIDISEEMLSIAKQKAEQKHITLKLIHADARSCNLKHVFDGVLSLFHVLSYQISNDDVHMFFNTANKHLSSGGVFLFDCWYGPGVLTDRPVSQYRTYEDNRNKVYRYKNPVLHIHESTVDVEHRLFIESKSSGYKPYRFVENHTLRYFFKPEIEEFLTATGFVLLEWGTLGNVLKKPKDSSWDCYFLAQKK